MKKTVNIKSSIWYKLKGVDRWLRDALAAGISRLTRKPTPKDLDAMLTQDIQRLALLSPHLLADIGLVQTDKSNLAKVAEITLPPNARSPR